MQYRLSLFKLLRLILFLFLICGKSEAQTHLPCGEVLGSETEIKQRERRILELKQNLSNANINTGMVYVPLKVHILREAYGTGGANLSDINKALTVANKQYANSNIQFYLYNETPHYIDNSSYYNFVNTDENLMCANNDVNNAVNIYFANTITYGGIAVSGYAYFPSGSSATNRIFVANNSIADGRTFAHELGHYFNLYHTFQSSTHAQINKRELVTRNVASGANCSTTGDLLCDTHADPFGRAADSTGVIGCLYAGNAKDVQGQLYTPNSSNVMSYYPTACGNIMSGGQFARVKDGLLLRQDAANQYSINSNTAVVNVNPPSGLTGFMGGSGVNLSFVDNSTNEMGFIIERSSISTTSGFAPIAGLPPNTTTFIDPTITAFTTYYYRVKASNATNIYSNVFKITVNLTYCIPAYNSPCDANSGIEVIIDDFELKETATNVSVISNLNSNCSPNNYGNFTGTAYNVEVGKNYTFTARSASASGGYASFFDQHLTIWIDYNRDGVFTSNEMIYKSNDNSSSRMNPATSGSFTIPAISAGIVRMRVRSGFEAFGPVVDSCSALDFGEAEDYHLNVIGPPPSITNTTVSPSNVCAGQNILVAFTTTIVGNPTYSVEVSDNNGLNFVAIPTFGTSSPLTATLPVGILGGSGYKVRVIATNPSVVGTASSAFTILATPPAPAVVSPVNYQQNQTATPLSATGTNISWYDAATAGNVSIATPTPSTATIGTTDYYVSQTVSGCESVRANIKVIVSAMALTISNVTVTNAPICTGQNISVSFSTNITTSTTYVIELSDNTGSNFSAIQTFGSSSPLTGLIPTNLVGSGNYKVRVVSNNPTIMSLASAVFSINTVPSAPAVTTPVSYQQNQVALPLSATGSNLKWYNTASGGTATSTNLTPSTTTVGTISYYVSQTVNGCESVRSAIQVNITKAPPTTSTACLVVRAFLEGPYLGNSQMTTNLNKQGLLPGQTPIDFFAVATPSGQPFNTSPWNYSGSETMATYNSDVVDWVLLSLRTNPEDKTTTVYKTAALLNKNGTITTIASCPTLSTSQNYHVVIDHRNHVGAVSHVAVPIVNNSITYNFSAQNSYLPTFFPAFGQTLINGIYCLFGGDCLKAITNEVNTLDNNKWRTNNGLFSVYKPTDLNLDGEVNAADRLIWRKNNGKYSGVDY